MKTVTAPSSKEIKRKELWEEFVSKKPSLDDYLDLARVIEDQGLRTLAMAKYAESPHDEEKLKKLIVHDSYLHLSDELAKVLMKRYGSVPNFSFVLHRDYGACSVIAAEHLLREPDVSHGVLLTIFRLGGRGHPHLLEPSGVRLIETKAPNFMLHEVGYRLESERAKIGEVILSRECSDCDLVWIIQFCPTLREKAWVRAKNITDVSESIHILHTFIKTNGDYRVEAAETLLGMNLPPESRFHAFFCIAKELPSLAPRVWDSWRDANLNHAQLESVIREIPTLKSLAENALKPPPRDLEAIKMELHMLDFENPGY